MSKNKNRSLTDALALRHTTTAILNSLFIFSFPPNTRKCVFRLAVIKHGAADRGFAVSLVCVFTQTPETQARVCCLMATSSWGQSI